MSHSSPLGNRIQRARAARGWSRAELSRSSNVPYTTLRHIETSEHPVKTNEPYLQAIAEALEIPFDELRILAGYLITPSTNNEQRERRIAAQIGAYPNLRRALETLLRRGDPAAIDQAASYLEFQNQQKR